MRTIAASIAILSGAIITSTWVISQAFKPWSVSSIWATLGLLVMIVGLILFLWSWSDNQAK